MTRPVHCAHFIVTGGCGYIGRAFVDAAIAEGRRVTILSRDARGLPSGVRHIRWRLGEDLPCSALDPDFPPETQALVHLAHDWRDANVETNLNLAGSRILLDSCRRIGLGRFIFASSLSARPDALNVYGRVKRQIELMLDRPNEISLRVGLVYGGPRMAQYGLLCRLATIASVMPMVAPHQPVQPIHRCEVARGLLLAAEGGATGVIGLATPQPLSFAEFLDTLAWRLRGGRMLLIPVPLRVVLLACAIINALPFLPHVGRERVLGLAGTKTMPTAADLARLGLEVTPFVERMLAEPCARRALLAEGRALLRYVLRDRPGPALVRRYARAIARTHTNGAMHLPHAIFQLPFLLRFLEPFGDQSLLAQRLKIATALAEASPEGGRALQSNARMGRLAWLAADVIVELLATPARLAATKLWR